jgi:hypothetical protein
MDFPAEARTLKSQRKRSAVESGTQGRTLGHLDVVFDRPSSSEGRTDRTQAAGRVRRGRVTSPQPGPGSPLRVKGNQLGRADNGSPR